MVCIFDLDGTLADISHRKHYVEKPWNHCNDCYELLISKYPSCPNCKCGRNPFTWKANWKAFFEECDKDKPISQTMRLFDFIGMNKQAHNLQIWSGRCESVREKTITWLKNYSFAFACHQFDIELKMRPIGDNTPDDQLKERWLDEVIAQGKTVYMVFDDRVKVIDMYRKRGIFVFDVSQGKGDF